MSLDHTYTTKLDLQRIEAAIMDERLMVKLGGSYWLARPSDNVRADDLPTTIVFSDGEWLMRWSARHRGFGYITSLNNNANGSLYKIFQPKG
jgi:hypothetical protein